MIVFVTALGVRSMRYKDTQCSAHLAERNKNDTQRRLLPITEAGQADFSLAICNFARQSLKSFGKIYYANIRRDNVVCGTLGRIAENASQKNCDAAKLSMGLTSVKA